MNYSDSASQYCIFRTNEKGFLLLPSEALVHWAGHYTLPVTSAKTGFMIETYLQLNTDNWKDAFIVMEDTMRVAKRSHDLLWWLWGWNRRCSTLAVQKEGNERQLFYSSGLHRLLTLYTPHDLEKMEEQRQEVGKEQFLLLKNAK